MFIILFFDDLSICAKDNKKIEMIKGRMSRRFRMKDMGKVQNYISIEINYDKVRGKIELSQTKYIETLASKYNGTYR